LLIRSGHVINPKNRVNAVMDGAVSNGKIAVVAERIPVESAQRVVDAAGLYVTPGLVDIHTHVFAGSTGPEDNGSLGVRPDGFTSATA
jgi:dihydroorotase